MKYRKLGKTGLRVSEIGFGCGNVGGLMIRGTHEDQVKAVGCAVELGINYFDTAAKYGNGQSEINLGRVLKELGPDVIVGSKVSLGEENLEDIKGAVQLSLKKSLERLNLDSIDLLQLHARIASNRNDETWRGALSLEDVLGENGVADAFESLKSQGLVRFVGFTGIGESAALNRVIDSDRFDTVQSYFNLLNPSAGYQIPPGFVGYDFDRLIDRAAEREVGVLAIRVLAAGATGGASSRTGSAAPTVRGPMVPGGEYDRDEARVRQLGFLLSGDAASFPQAAIRFALGHSGVSVVLVGVSSASQVEEAAACSELGPLPEGAVEKLKALWANNFKGGS